MLQKQADGHFQSVNNDNYSIRIGWCSDTTLDDCTYQSDYYTVTYSDNFNHHYKDYCSNSQYKQNIAVLEVGCNNYWSNCQISVTDLTGSALNGEPKKTAPVAVA